LWDLFLSLLTNLERQLVITLKHLSENCQAIRYVEDTTNNRISSDNSHYFGQDENSLSYLNVVAKTD